MRQLTEDVLELFAAYGHHDVSELTARKHPHLFKAHDIDPKDFALLEAQAREHFDQRHFTPHSKPKRKPQLGRKSRPNKQGKWPGTPEKRARRLAVLRARTQTELDKAEPKRCEACRKVLALTTKNFKKRRYCNQACGDRARAAKQGSWPKKKKKAA